MVMQISIKVTANNARGEQALRLAYDEQITRQERRLAERGGFYDFSKTLNKGTLLISYKLRGSAEIRALQEAIEHHTHKDFARKGAYPTDYEIEVNAQ